MLELYSDLSKDMRGNVELAKLVAKKSIDMFRDYTVKDKIKESMPDEMFIVKNLDILEEVWGERYVNGLSANVVDEIVRKTDVSKIPVEQLEYILPMLTNNKSAWDVITIPDAKFNVICEFIPQLEKHFPEGILRGNSRDNEIIFRKYQDVRKLCENIYESGQKLTPMQMKMIALLAAEGNPVNFETFEDFKNKPPSKQHGFTSYRQEL